MIRPFLVDRQDLTTSKRVYTDEGFLNVPAVIARTGIQVYLASELQLKDRDPKEMIRVFRPPEEVFDAKSMASFSHKPVTDDHPPELVNAKNSKKFSVGMSGPKVEQNGELLETTLHIIDDDAVQNIESGKVEVSNGYTSDVTLESGVTQDGEEYDAIQRNIRGNHIALVTRGRAGSACRVADNSPKLGDKPTMAIVTIDGVTYEVTEQVAQAVSKVQANLTTSQVALDSSNELNIQLEADLLAAKAEGKKTTDSMQAQIDTMDAAVPKGEVLAKMVTSQIKLIDDARNLVPEIKWENKSASDLKKAVIADRMPGVDLAGKSDDYINASFDHIAAAFNANSQGTLDHVFSSQFADGKQTEILDTRSTSEIARERRDQRGRDAWTNQEAS